MEIENVKRVELPFTLYDLFGYLLPGIAYIMLILFPSDARKALDFAIHSKPITFTEFHPFLTGAFVDFFHSSPWFVTGYSLIIGYILGHVIAAISSFVLERYSVESNLRYPAANLFSLYPNDKAGLFKKYKKAYEPTFIRNYSECFQSRFKVPFANDREIFWLSFEFVAQNCPVAFARSIHFLNLYGFSRNLSMTFILAAFTILVYDIVFGFHIYLVVVSAYFAIAFLLFWNYLKLLRRLTDEVFRAFYTFVVTHPQSTSKLKSR